MEDHESKKFQTKKSLGQHFLNSDVVPRWLADAGAVGAGDTVLEIGPGTGALTVELLKRGATVYAIEADNRAIESLQERFSSEIAAGAVRVEQGDMRMLSATDVAQIFDLRDHEYKLVANIPYYLSGLLFRTFLETDTQPSTLVFLVQKEIAKRIAHDSKESLLSLSVKAFGEPTYVRPVTRGHFSPPPKVDSAIIAVHNITRDAFGSKREQDRFFSLLRLGFGQKRKQLLGNLSSQFARSEVLDHFSTLNINPTVRAEDLPLKTWLALCTHIHRL